MLIILIWLYQTKVADDHADDHIAAIHMNNGHK